MVLAAGRAQAHAARWALHLPEAHAPVDALAAEPMHAVLHDVSIAQYAQTDRARELAADPAFRDCDELVALLFAAFRDSDELAALISAA